MTDEGSAGQVAAGAGARASEVGCAIGDKRALPAPFLGCAAVPLRPATELFAAPECRVVIGSLDADVPCVIQEVKRLNCTSFCESKCRSGPTQAAYVFKRPRHRFRQQRFHSLAGEVAPLASTQLGRLRARCCALVVLPASPCGAYGALDT